jgi:hypothetical protein
VDSTRLGPPLQLWHTVQLEAEYRHGRTDVDDWRRYLELEDALFAEMQAEVYARIPSDQRQEINRYYAQSPYKPTAFAQDYNRSWELAHAEPRGAAVLIHGLTDSPYSVRALAGYQAYLMTQEVQSGLEEEEKTPPNDPPPDALSRGAKRPDRPQGLW